MVRRLLVLLVPIALVAGACTDDDPVLEPSGTTTSSTSTTSPTSSTETSAAPGTTEATSGTTSAGSGTVMQGPAGSGEMSYRLVAERSEFCYHLSVSAFGEPTEAHVHRMNDEVVLALQPPDADGSVDTCAATDALLIEEMNAAPETFYIDVHGPQGVLKAPLG